MIFRATRDFLWSLLLASFFVACSPAQQTVECVTSLDCPEGMTCGEEGLCVEKTAPDSAPDKDMADKETQTEEAELPTDDHEETDDALAADDALETGDDIVETGDDMIEVGDDTVEITDDATEIADDAAETGDDATQPEEDVVDLDTAEVDIPDEDVADNDTVDLQPDLDTVDEGTVDEDAVDLLPDLDTAPDPCAGNPCDDHFDFGASCQPDGAAFTCTCSTGFDFTSSSCYNINECTLNTDECAQLCDDATPVSPNYIRYTCDCNGGYTLNADGKNCDDIDECATNHGGCRDGGDSAAICGNTTGGFTCDCTDDLFIFDDGLDRCVDVNECLDGNNGGCDPLTACENTVGGRTCGACPSGYTGNGYDGCVDIDECAADAGDGNPCNNEGDTAATCGNTAGGFTCICSASYEFLQGACRSIDTDPVIIGTGIDDQRYPLGYYYKYERSISLYTAAEIGVAGTIRKLAWFTETASDVDRSVTIYLKHTSDAAVPANTWANLTSGATQVYSGLLSANSANVWTDFALDTPFAYNGTGHLYVLVLSHHTTGTASAIPNVRYTNSTNRFGRIESDTDPSSVTATVNDRRPNIKISF